CGYVGTCRRGAEAFESVSPPVLKCSPGEPIRWVDCDREGRAMAVGGAFDNRSLRTKIGVAVLIATVSGLIVGGLAINTVHRLNDDAAASQQQTLALETAVGSFSKNIEAFGGSVSALQLYP